MKTTAQVLKKYDSISYGFANDKTKAYDSKDVKEAMIEFAKLALKEVANQVELKYVEKDYGGVRAGSKYKVPIVDEQSIINIAITLK